MTNIARARRILESMTSRWGKPATARDAAQALADAGLLAPEPQIIHTLTDLEALDPDTILGDSAGPYTAGEAVGAIYEDDYEDRDYLPAVVIATGDQVRAARQTLEKE